MDSETTGKTGEQIAENFLKKQGYEILAVNFKNNFGRRLGELDIIGRDAATRQIVFVEVKTRDFKKYSNTLPEENITYGKLRKLDKIAQFYLKTHNLSAADYRFDAISILLDKENKQAQIRHLKNIYL